MLAVDQADILTALPAALVPLALKNCGKLPINSYEDSLAVANDMSSIQLYTTLPSPPEAPASLPGQPAAASVETTQSVGAATLPVFQPNLARQAVNQSLQQALNKWQQQQASLLKQSAARSQRSQSQQLDGSRMEMLKERIKNLRQMMVLVGKDKGGLRSIAMQLKQISAELRQMVASATGNDQQQSLVTTLSGNPAAAATDTASASSGSDAGQQAATSATTSDAATTANSPQDASTAGSTPASDAASVGSSLAGSGIALAGGASGLNGNAELQSLINSIKSIQQWLKQRNLQAQDDGLKKLLDAGDKDMAAIDNMLHGGSDSAEGESQLTIQLTDAGGAAASIDSGTISQHA